MYFESEEECLVVHTDHLDEDVFTNDLVELLDDTHFKWLGRKDLIINSGGLKINPENLEMSILNNFGINVAFTGKPDQQLGEKLVLIIEENAANTTFDIRALEQHIEKEFSKYYKPKEVHFVKQIPRTESGKIDRSKLRNGI